MIYPLLCVVLAASGARTQSGEPRLSPEARAYLTAALDTLEAGDVGRRHVAVGRRARQRRVPQRGGKAVALGDSLDTAVRGLAEAGVCGWIVDLRSNGGGNVWPMLAGIGPLLGDSIVGSFGGEGEGHRWFYRDGVAGMAGRDGVVDTISRVTVPPVPMIAPTAPVAFIGRANVRSFGASTAGYATANRGSRLPDGANMVVTTGYFRDRRGVQRGPRLEPDVSVAGGAPGWPYATDRVAEVAAAWSEGQPGCRRTDGMASPGFHRPVATANTQVLSYDTVDPALSSTHAASAPTPRSLSRTA